MNARSALSARAIDNPVTTARASSNPPIANAGAHPVLAGRRTATATTTALHASVAVVARTPSEYPPPETATANVAAAIATVPPCLETASLAGLWRLP